MASYVDPEELIGSLDGLITFIDDHNAALTAKGLTTATIKTSLTAARTDLNTKKTTRDNKKADLTTAQRTFETSAGNNYTTFSDAIDLIMGAVGKKSAEAKQVQNLRKNVTKSGGRTSSSSSSTSNSSSSSSS